MLSRRSLLSLLGLAPVAAVAAKFAPLEELGGVPLERGILFTEYYDGKVSYGFADDLVDLQRDYNRFVTAQLRGPIFTTRDTIYNGVVVRDVDEIVEGPSRTSVIIPGVECE